MEHLGVYLYIYMKLYEQISDGLTGCLKDFSDPNSMDWVGWLHRENILKNPMKFHQIMNDSTKFH